MFVLGVHYCVQLLPGVILFVQTVPLPFPLQKLVSFTFLVSFIWNSQKCPIVQNIWCLKKTIKKTASTQFLKGVVHDQPWSTIVCLFWGSTIVSSCFLRWVVFFQTFPLPFPLLKLSSFTFLVSFTSNFQKCPISQNIECHFKTQLKKQHKQFFKGVVHEQPWSTMVCLFWGSTIVSSWFLRCFFFSNIPFTFSFAKVFFFYGISMVLLLDFYGIPMEFPWCFFDISGGFLWYFWSGAVGILWYSYGISIGFLCFLLWYFFDVSIIFLWGFYWMPVGLLLDSCGISKVFPWCFYDISMGLL